MEASVTVPIPNVPCQLDRILDENDLDHRGWNVLLFHKKVRPELRDVVKNSCLNYEECAMCLKRFSVEEFKREFAEA